MPETPPYDPAANICIGCPGCLTGGRCIEDPIEDWDDHDDHDQACECPDCTIDDWDDVPVIDTRGLL